MDASNFTTRSQQAINAAIETAASSGHAQVEATHLLDALLKQPEGIIHPLLQAVGVQPSAIESAVRAELAKLATASGSAVAAPSYSRAALQVLAKANDIATEMKDDYVSTEHLLVATATVDSPAAKLLASAGRIRRGAARRADQRAGHDPGDEPGPGVDVPGAREVRRRPHRHRARGQARPGHRPRQRDPSRRSRCCRGAPRTTRCSSASPASARPPSSRGSRSASSTATCPTR